MNPQEYKQLNDAVDKMRRSKLFVDDHGSINIHQLRSKLRKLKIPSP
jgi:replicative DNA helicase